jgi:hypothetical protein
MAEKSILGRFKLSKKLLMELPTGAYLVSNCYKPIGPSRVAPAFTESVAPPAEREVQWRRLRAASADHRLCFIYRSLEDYERSLRENR